MVFSFKISIIGIFLQKIKNVTLYVTASSTKNESKKKSKKIPAITAALD